MSCISLPPAPPPAPSITGFSITTGESFTVELSETPGSCERIDGFTFKVIPDDLSCNKTSMTNTEVTCLYNHTHMGQMYNFTAAALNCGNQRGDETSISVNMTGMSFTNNTY